MMGYLLDGGWMMLPLLLCSIGLLAVVIDRGRAFRAAAIDHETLRRDVRRVSVGSGRAIAEQRYTNGGEDERGSQRAPCQPDRQNRGVHFILSLSRLGSTLLL